MWLKKANQGWMDAPVWFNFARSAQLCCLQSVRTRSFWLSGSAYTTAAVSVGGDRRCRLSWRGHRSGVWCVLDGRPPDKTELERLANVDPLTGIHNRRSFIALCEHELLKLRAPVTFFRSSCSIWTALSRSTIATVIALEIPFFARGGEATTFRPQHRRCRPLGRRRICGAVAESRRRGAMIVAHRLRYHVDSITVPARACQ